MAANTVEAILKSKYEDGIDKGVENTRQLMEHAFGSMKNGAAIAGAGIEHAFESVVGGLDSWRSNLSRAADDTENGFHKMSLGALALGLAVTAVFLRAAKSAADFVIEIVKESSAIFEARNAFDNLTKSAGIQASVLSKELKEATLGQVSGLTLLRNANKVLQAELPITSDQYVKLVGNVFRLAKSTGADAVAAQDALTTALIRGQSRGLGPAIGVHLAVKDAVNAMAEAMGESAGKMADHSKLVAFYNELLDKSTKAVERNGKEHLTLEDLINQSERTYKGFFSTLGVGILRSQVFQELLEKTSKSLLDVSVSGEHQNQIALHANALIIDLVRDFAGFVTVLGVVVTVLNTVGGAVLFVINGAFAVLATAVLAVTAVVYAFLETLAHIPGAVGKAFRGAADEAKYAVDYTAGLLRGFASAAGHSFDAPSAGLFDMAAKARGLADELEKVRNETVKADGVQRLGETAKAAAGDQKALNSQLEQFRNLMFSLSQTVADADTKDLQEFAHRGVEISRLDKLSHDQRKELYDAAWSVYIKSRGDRAREAAELQAKEDQARLQSLRELDDQLYGLSGDGYQKAELQYWQHLEKINSLTAVGSGDRIRLTALAGVAYQEALDKLAAEELKKAEELARKKEEQRRKEISDAIATANLIASVIENRSKFSKGIVDQAFGSVAQTITQVKTKLAELQSQKTFSAQQIQEIIRLKEALEKLNQINLTPFRKALLQLKQDMQNIGAEAIRTWGQFWSDITTGQDGAGKKFLAGLINIVAQEFEIMAARQTAQAIAAAADLDWAGAARHGAAALALGALGGILSGIASNLAQSKSSAASSAPAASGGSTGQSSPSTPTQVINVGAAGRAAAPLPQEHKITIDVRPQEAFIVRTVVSDVAGNGEIRKVIKKNG